VREAAIAASQHVDQRHVVLSPTIHNWIARRYAVSPDADKSEGEGTWICWIGRSCSSLVPAWELVSSLPRRLPGRLSLDLNGAHNVPNPGGASALGAALQANRRAQGRDLIRTQFACLA
jgi:hypothetical protein